jgi:hypothetical protein
VSGQKGGRANGWPATPLGISRVAGGQPSLTLSLCLKSHSDMPGFLIPLLIAAVVLGLLGILLWLGARERRQFSTMYDTDVGNLKLFKTCWEAVAPKSFGEKALPVSGVGRNAGPTATQKRTLNFIRANDHELCGLAVAATKKAVTAAAAALQLDDIRVSSIFLHEEPDSFELSLDSESCAAAMPDGVTVSLTGKQIDAVEFVH